MFHQGPMSDNKLMSVDVAPFFVCKNPINCLLSMNKSASRCALWTSSLSCRNVHRTHIIFLVLNMFRVDKCLITY